MRIPLKNLFLQQLVALFCSAERDLVNFIESSPPKTQ